MQRGLSAALFSFPPPHAVTVGYHGGMTGNGDPTGRRPSQRSP